MPFAQTLKAARRILAAYEPILASTFSDTLLAAWLAGAHRVVSGLPEMPTAEQQGTPWYAAAGLSPTIGGGSEEPPPPFVRTVGAAGEAEPVVHFPIIEEAARDLAKRRILKRADFDALANDAKTMAFTAARVGSDNALTALRDALTFNVAEGQTLREFVRAVDDALGEGESALSPGHIENIYRTNGAQAYTTGLLETLNHPLVADEFPYLAYHAVHDARTRPDHLEMERLGLDGTNVYRRDDPIWQRFAPPWDYQCRCAIVPLSVADAAKAGVREAQQWLRTGEAPATPQWVPAPPFAPPPDWGTRPAVRLSQDDDGHEHGKDGRFAAKGKGGAAEKRQKTREQRKDYWQQRKEPSKLASKLWKHVLDLPMRAETEPLIDAANRATDLLPVETLGEHRRVLQAVRKHAFDAIQRLHGAGPGENEDADDHRANLLTVRRMALLAHRADKLLARLENHPGRPAEEGGQVRLSVDDEGHEHAPAGSGKGGQFTAKGGGGGAGKGKDKETRRQGDKEKGKDGGSNSKPATPAAVKKEVRTGIKGLLHNFLRRSSVETKKAERTIAAKIGKSRWNKLPAKLQKSIAFAHAASQKILYAIDTPLRLGLNLAKTVARERGFDEKHVEKVARVVNAIDQLATLPVVGVYTHAAKLLSPALGPISGYVPFAALSYVAYSSARDPYATIRAARKLAGNWRAAVTTKLSLEVEDDAVAALFDAYQRHQGDNWFDALLHAGLDATRDLGEAVRWAERVRGAQGDGLQMSLYRGPEAPGPDWELVGTGPRGGKIWKRREDKSARPTVTEAKEHAERIFNGQGTAEDVSNFAAKLARMRLKDIAELKKQLGIRAGGPKSALVQKVVTQASKRLSQREHWQRQARIAGVKPSDMFLAAKDMYNTDNEYVSTVQRLLKETRELYARENPGKVLSRSHRAFRGDDLASIRGFDTIARTMAERFPELLGAHGYSNSGAGYDDNAEEAGQRLYEFLAAGTPPRPKRSQYYEQAIDVVKNSNPSGERTNKEDRPLFEDDEDEEVPF